jgi:hypothetical protein
LGLKKMSTDSSRYTFVKKKKNLIPLIGFI